MSLSHRFGVSSPQRSEPDSNKESEVANVLPEVPRPEHRAGRERGDGADALRVYLVRGISVQQEGVAGVYSHNTCTA